MKVKITKLQTELFGRLWPSSCVRINSALRAEFKPIHLFAHVGYHKGIIVVSSSKLGKNKSVELIKKYLRYK